MYIYYKIYKIQYKCSKKKCYKFRKKKKKFLPQDIYGFVFQETYIYIYTVYIQSKYNDMENKYE